MRAEIEPAVQLAIGCALDLAALEVSEGIADTLEAALGLEPDQLSTLASWRPSLLTGDRRHGSAPSPCDDEAALRALLAAACVAPPPFSNILPAIIARRSMREDHLWQDLGLPHRAALSELMARAFPRLHAANDRDMKWKRFFYRALCEAEGFSLCAVPHCRDCTDFERCFGKEDGQSAFVRRSRAAGEAGAAESAQPDVRAASDTTRGAEL